MSFLTYTSHPVLFATSVGGVTLGVALLLMPWKSVTLRDSFSHPLLSSSRSHSPSSKTLIEKENNCKVVSLELENLNMLFQNSHIAISCENKGERDDSFFEHYWLALFPLGFFKKEEVGFIKEKGLKISTLTELVDEEKLDTEEPTKTTIFSSESFLNGYIAGSWKYEKWLYGSGGEILYVVDLKEPYSLEKIFFVHKYRRR